MTKSDDLAYLLTEIDGINEMIANLHDRLRLVEGYVSQKMVEEEGEREKRDAAIAETVAAIDQVHTGKWSCSDYYDRVKKILHPKSQTSP